MKSAFKKLFNGKSKDGTDLKDPPETLVTPDSNAARFSSAKDSIPAVPAKDAALAPASAPQPPSPAGAAPAAAAAAAMAKMSMNDSVSSVVSPFTQLNTKIVGAIVQSLHPNMSPAQLAGITAGLNAAKDMFAKNAGKRVKDTYRVGKLLGAGAFAKVFSGVHKVTGDEVAIKMITKNDPFDLKQRPDILKEMAIMTMLKSHPHTTTMFDAYEDDSFFVLVLELCKGGELFDAIIKRHHLTEKDAAEIMQSITSVVKECHERGIIHRDLKPENVLLKDNSKKVNVKIIDFGTSSFCADGQELNQQFGTPYYVAPEVLLKAYGKQADVWSSGVIMYILLCGYPPFGGRSDDVILNKIVQGKYSFEGKEWTHVSAEAKDMIARMLVMDAAQRSTAEQLLQHPWFKIQEASVAGASNPMGNLMMQRLKQFGGMQRMKRLALTCLVRTLNNRDVKRLLELFEANDPEKTGKLDRDSFHRALERVGATIEFEELESLLELDPAADDNGMIDYNDFVAAMLDTDRVAKKREAVRRSFEALDTDGDGVISAADIVKASKGRFSVEMAREMVGETAGREVKDGEEAQIDYATFEKMMQS